MWSFLAIRHWRFPLFWQVLLAISVLLCLSTGVIWLYLSSHFNDLLQQQTDTFALAITHQTADAAAELVMADDKMALSAMLESVAAKTTSIQHIAIYDHHKDLLVQASSQKPSLTLSISQYQAPIVFQDVIAGEVRLTLDNSAIVTALINSRKAVGIITISVGVLAFILAILLARGLTAPLKRLNRVASKIADGDLNPPLPHSKNDEVGDLVKGFKLMLKGLRDKESIEHKFSSYISKDIAKGILSDLSVPKTPMQAVRGSVLFVDIVGFTQLCEKESPKQVAGILNHYYFLLHQAAKMYRGTVDNYIGDGAMLTFGVHKEDSKHAINAICAAEIFLRLTHLLNSQRIEQDLPTLDFRLGLHCGDMLAGTIGSTERMQLTITGDTVNQAARLCEVGHPNKLLVSDAVVSHPSVEGLVITSKPSGIQLKGKSRETICYQVERLAPKFNRLLMQQEAEMDAMEDYA